MSSLLIQRAKKGHIHTFWDSLMASMGVGWRQTPRIVGATKGMTSWVWLWNSYQMLVFVRRHIAKKIDIICLVCGLQTEMLITTFWNATSTNNDLTKFCKITNIELRYWHWKFQIDISKSVKCRKKRVCKIQNDLYDPN